MRQERVAAAVGEAAVRRLVKAKVGDRRWYDEDERVRLKSEKPRELLEGLQLAAIDIFHDALSLSLSLPPLSPSL